MGIPIRVRLTLVFAALMVVFLAIAGALFYRSFASQLDQPIDSRLLSLAVELAADLASGESTVLGDFGQGDSEGFFAQVLARDGSIQEASGTPEKALVDLNKLPPGARPALVEGAGRLDSGAMVKPSRLSVIAASGNRVVVVGTYLQDRNRALRELATLLWITVPLLCLAASGFAWLLSGAALRPVENLRRQAALISESDLTRRLPVPATGDEIATLATTLNDMLARLEQAFERERRFVDDASRELRTPLGNLKTELDLARRRSRTKEELEAVLISATEESERLNLIAENLLVLARSDRGKLPLKKTKVDAEALVQSTLARFHAKAQGQAITFDVSVAPGLRIDVDAFRIQQAIGNLIANALACTSRGGKIHISARVNGIGELALSVADAGPGFPAAFIEKAFDPFTRADTGRSRRDGGAGLGLAIVKGIAEAHGGSAEAGNRPDGGATVTLRIPL